MKSIRVIFAVAAILSLMIGCSSISAMNSDVSVAEPEKTRICSLILPVESTYYRELAEEFEVKVREADYTPETVYLGEYSAQTQEELLYDLISRQVSSISLVPIDSEGVQEAMSSAVKADIPVVTLDSPGELDSRTLSIRHTDWDQAGMTLMDAVLDLSQGAGEWAMVSSVSSVQSYGELVTYMQELSSEEKYVDLTLSEVAYSDGMGQRAYDQTKSLLQNYPDLSVIVVPSPDDMASVCSAVRDSNSNTLVTGFAVASDMEEYLGNVCPYYYLWDGKTIGGLSGAVSTAFAEHQITAEVGERLSISELGEYEVREATDGGSEIIAGPPVRCEK